MVIDQTLALRTKSIRTSSFALFSTYCEKRFTNSGDLQIHVRIHTVSRTERKKEIPAILRGNFLGGEKTSFPGSK